MIGGESCGSLPVPRLVLALILALLLAVPALADKRIGLVIGNDAYQEVPPLDKARADAVAIAGALAAQGFEIIRATDATRRDMNRRISDFTARLEPGDTAFVFYAGHGVEIDGENYLLPTDIAAPASGEQDFIAAESIALSDLLDRVRGTGARAAIVIVDACRNNPFEATTGRSIGRTRGLGRITAPQGTFVIFSAGAGQLALDELTEDDGAANSVFTRALLPKLAQPGLELRAMMSDLRLEVRNLARQVNHVQVPAYYDELIGEFYFAKAGPEPAAEPAAQPPGNDSMRADFELAQEIGTPEALNLFLDRYKHRKDDFVYQLALRLRDDRRNASPSRTTAEPAKPKVPQPSPAPAPAPEPDRRALLRDTQAALNAVGCDAGPADGVIGPRTRRAYADFIAQSDAGLVPGDLGSQRALDLVQAADGRVCKPAPAAPAATGGPATAAAPAAPAFDLSGDWRYFASCRFGVKIFGSVSYRKTGPGRYAGRLLDSLGRQGSATVQLNGRSLSGTNRWPTNTETIAGTVSEDGSSFSGRSSAGCRFTVRR